MNLRALARVSDAVTVQNLTKLVTAFLKEHRTDKSAVYPFSSDGMAGEVAKKNSTVLFTFYKIDNKPLKEPVVATVELPEKGTAVQLAEPVAEEIEPIVNKKEVKRPTKLDNLRTKLGEAAVAAGSAVINAANNIKVEKF